MLIQHDETAEGLTQIILSYTLTLVTIILGLVTIWLGSSSISRELEECQLQVLVTKPIARWEIWLGKLLGIQAINLTLIIFAGAIILTVLTLKSGELSEAEKLYLNEKILVARSSVTEEPPDLKPFIKERFDRIVEEQELPTEQWKAVEARVEKNVIDEYQSVWPGANRQWVLNFKNKRKSLEGKPLFARVKVETPIFVLDEEDPQVYATQWMVGKIRGPNSISRFIEIPIGVWHEIILPPDIIDPDGNLYIAMDNLSPSKLIFKIDDSFEVLYREGGFVLNFFRGIFILFCWLTLICILALFASTFLSFSVAAFLCMTALMLFFSKDAIEVTLEDNTILGIEYNDPTTGPRRNNAVVDGVFLPVFEAFNFTIDLVADFSPVESLSDGRTITLLTTIRAFAQIVLLMGGILGAIGILIFQRREIAAAQGK